MNLKLLFEAIVVGTILMVTGVIVNRLLRLAHEKTKLTLIPEDYEFDEWNKHRIVEVSLFITGFLAYIILDVLGVNKWYCINRAVNLAT